MIEATAALLFALSQTAPAVLTYPWRSNLSAILALIKREPVRTAALIIAVAVVLVSVFTGVPVATIVAQVVAYAAVAEKVRDAVTPVVKLAAEEADQDAKLYVVRPGPDDAPPAA